MSILKIIPSNIKDICLIISFFSLFYLISHPLPSPLPTTITTVVQPPSTTAHRHVFYSIASSSKSYLNRQPYLRLWFTPNLTTAAVFLDRPVTGDSKFSGEFSDLPPVVISGDTSRFPYTFPRGLRSAIRVARIVKETVELFDSDELRWYVFGDDDTVFMTENVVRVLNKYDYRKWYYIGSNSESYEQNFRHSFDMAFGGGGFAISRSLAKVLASVLDSCLMRYPHVYGSDSRVYSCLVELGVELTNEPGFHQVVPMQFMRFASGSDVKKITLITKDVIYKVSVKELISGCCLIFGRSWDMYKSSKGVIDGWNIHFRSVSNKYLRITGYNLEGITTDCCDNFRGRDHSCITVASSLSKDVQIFAKEFFKHLDSRVFLPITVITCHGIYNVDGRVISEKVYGFDGPSWELLFSNENIVEGQKMVLCYLGDFSYRLTVFDRNGFEVNQLTNALGDDRYDRVVDAATRQMVLVED